MKSKYYHAQTQQEWDWLFKHFNLVNTKPEIQRWSNFGKRTVVVTPADTPNNWGYENTRIDIMLGITDFIEVSDLMKEEEMKDKIVFTKEEKEEFDELKKEYTTLYSVLFMINEIDFPKLFESLFNNSFSQNNLAQLEFARAWANPDLIEVKEPRFAYELKPQFQDTFNIHSRVYLRLDGKNDINKRYYTQSEWQQVDDDLKVIFDRVEEE
ncbi:hypothetical protein vBOeSunk162_31 [Oenococcus phage vB_OeS_unk162]|nr:hypothetical protein vBOeSunk162_31 [Oenococcus phage vB_OeS_unk162]